MTKTWKLVVVLVLAQVSGMAAILGTTAVYRTLHNPNFTWLGIGLGITVGLLGSIWLDDD